jgi:hypothetical protein
LISQDTYYLGTIKEVGRIYQQTVIDTYSKVAFAKLYDRKNALVAAEVLNDKVIPKPDTLKQMEFVNGSIRQFKMSSMHQLFEKSL